ncbi:oocyte zinc finger protein XlCOF8.4-like [Anomaloglossus baeobatrachus]|uniref:oocyte zinc finger protein XlCOF8.4-like n=1 Tax=Anomaloglossus baeobatrachus TaxID=238106 RepID=UPI003F4FD2D8
MDTSHHKTEQILDLTLEIIYLLTGEDYIIVKKSDKYVTADSDHQASGRWSKIRSSIMGPRPPSLIHERSNKQKIIEVTNKILQMLMAEDVTVNRTTEEWDFMEEHKDRCKDAMMEEHQPLTPPDASGNSPSPQGCPRPLYPREGPEENPNVPQDQQIDGLIIVKVEETEGDKEYYRGDVLRSGEETPTNVSTDAAPSLGYRPLSSGCEAEPNGTQSINELQNMTMNISSLIHSGDPLSVHNTLTQPPPDHSQTLHLIPGPGGENQINDPNSKGPFPCPVCEKLFNIRSNLFHHIKIHPVKPICTMCGKCFKRKTDLIRHHKTHKGEKPFLCSECGNLFTVKADLLPLVSEEQPFPRPICGKCFFQKSDAAHQNQGAHKAEKPYSCTACGKGFIHKRNLVQHEKTHTKEKS